MATNTPFGQRLGLVLEGGAMRGIYTAGVLDVFLEAGIMPDVVVGVSAGALHGCSYVAGQKGRSIRYYRKYRSDKHFMGLYSLLTTGDVVGTKFCYEDIPLRLDPFNEAAFEKAPVDFYVTVTNVRTGKPEYILCDELKVGSKMDVIRAGASMPLCSKMVEWNGNLYLDGGVSDSIPYAKMKDFGCRKSIVVLTQPAGYLKQPAAMAPQVSRLCGGHARPRPDVQHRSVRCRTGRQTGRCFFDSPQQVTACWPYGTRHRSSECTI